MRAIKPQLRAEFDALIAHLYGLAPDGNQNVEDASR
jgi:hypothetical protein